MADDGERPVPESLHERDDVPGHGPLGVRRMVGRRRGLGRPAVAAAPDPHTTPSPTSTEVSAKPSKKPVTRPSWRAAPSGARVIDQPGQHDDAAAEVLR
jgi:hypothetical protein